MTGVMSTVGVFIALGGTAYAVNTIGSTDIVDGQVKSVDIGDGEIGSSDVKDNSINTFDVHSFLGVDVVDKSLQGNVVGEESFVITQGVGTVAPNTCVYGPPFEHPGIGNDHVVLTPNYEDTNAYLTYTAEVHAAADRLRIKVCNASTLAREDNSVAFRVLSIGP